MAAPPATIDSMTQGHLSTKPSFAAPLLGGAPLDAIKLMAAVLMVVDHANHIWFGGAHLTAYLLGRAAFPLFCWAAAAAILRAGDDRRLYRQAGLLLLFAILTEPISRLTRDYDVLNVLFTLSLGVLAAPAVLRLPTVARLVLSVAAAAAVGFGGWWEFGFAGFLLPAMIAAAIRDRKVTDMAGVLLLLAIMNFRGYWGWAHVEVAGAAIVVLSATLWPAFILWLVAETLRDRGRGPSPPRRLMPRYALHVFYPAHMLVLWLARFI